MAVAWFLFFFCLVMFGAVGFYVGMERLVIVSLNGMDKLLGRDPILLNEDYDPSHPWRYLLRWGFFVIGGGTAFFAGVMMLLGAFGIAPKWWYRYVVGQ